MAAALRIFELGCAEYAGGDLREMNDLFFTAGAAFVGGIFGAWLTYYFGLKGDLLKDKEERRRERIVAHLIEAYRNLEHSVYRGKMTEEMEAKFESSLGSIFLFGSKEAADEANKLAEDVAAGSGGLISMLKILRRDLRLELGLEQHDVELKFLRFVQNKK